jgi:hypothetical protein
VDAGFIVFQIILSLAVAEFELFEAVVVFVASEMAEIKVEEAFVIRGDEHIDVDYAAFLVVFHNHALSEFSAVFVSSWSPLAVAVAANSTFASMGVPMGLKRWFIQYDYL